MHFDTYLYYTHLGTPVVCLNLSFVHEILADNRVRELDTFFVDGVRILILLRSPHHFYKSNTTRTKAPHR